MKLNVQKKYVTRTLSYRYKYDIGTARNTFMKPLGTQSLFGWSRLRGRLGTTFYDFCFGLLFNWCWPFTFIFPLTQDREVYVRPFANNRHVIFTDKKFLVENICTKTNPNIIYVPLTMLFLLKLINLLVQSLSDRKPIVSYSSNSWPRFLSRFYKLNKWGDNVGRNQEIYLQTDLSKL